MNRFDLELRVLLVLALANGIAESSVVPLQPAIQSALGLSAVETGLVWTTTTLAMLVAALPIGYAANRLGSRTLLLGAAILMPIALVGQALAGSLAVLLGARFLFGLSFGIVWVIGPARAAAGGRGASGTGPLIASAGVGWLVGPVLAGVVADAAGWRAASAVLSLLVVPVIPLVHRYAAPRVAGERIEPVRVREALSLVRRSRTIAGAALVGALLGVVGGASNVLVPAALDTLGLSAAGIGFAFGFASAVWIATAVLIGRARSLSSLRGVGLIVAVMAVIWFVPALRLTTLALVAFLVVSTACRASVNALNYAVGVRASLGDTAPVVVGLLNLAWALTALVSPLLAGLAESSSGVRLGFGVTALVAMLVAAALLAAPRARVRVDALPS